MLLFSRVTLSIFSIFSRSLALFAGKIRIRVKSEWGDWVVPGRLPLVIGAQDAEFNRSRRDTLADS